MVAAEGDGRIGGSFSHLLGVVEALEVVLAEEAAVGGLAAAAHALAEIQPEVVAAALVPVDAPPGRHRRRAFLLLRLVDPLWLLLLLFLSPRRSRSGSSSRRLPLGCSLTPRASTT